MRMMMYESCGSFDVTIRYSCLLRHSWKLAVWMDYPSEKRNNGIKTDKADI